MKKTLLCLVMTVMAAPAIAQNLPAQFADLPDLPQASQLSSDYVGGHYLLGQGIDKEPVVFVGFNLQGSALAYSLTDIPERKMSQQDAFKVCEAKGQSWEIPAIDEIMLLNPHVDDSVIGYLPGSHWTQTPAPCDGCAQPKNYFMVYDPLSGNQGNSYNTEYIFKFYASCVYQF